MSTIDRVGIKEKLMSAIDRESLPNREAARLLNIHPCYVSMLKNESSWEGITPKVWDRFNEWFQTRDLLANFQIPEGEEIYKPKEKEKPVKVDNKVDRKKLQSTFSKSDEHFAVADTDMHPLNPAPDAIIKLSYYKEEADKSTARILQLLKENEKLMDTLDNMKKTPPNMFPVNTQKLSLDIEINLIINGQKVRL
jgi:hypothetical protein